METQNHETKKKSKVPFIILGAVVLVAGFIGIKQLIHAINYESTDNAQIETNTVPIVSRLSGYVDSVALIDYQDVKQGALLLHIDDREYRIAVQQAEADVLSAEADITNAKAQLTNAEMSRNYAQANADVQQVRLNKAQEDLQRDEALLKDQSITRKQYLDSKSNFETAQKLLRASKDQLQLASSQIVNAHAQIEKNKAVLETKKAILDNAVLKLSYTRITAPFNGKVGKTNLQKGQYVQPGQNLFTIVNNDEFWIVANFKETQLEKLKEGMEAEISVDGYPDKVVKAKISGMSDATGARFALLPPDNATGNFVKVTQRVPVKLSIENLEEVRSFLKAGLSVTVDIKTN